MTAKLMVAALVFITAFAVYLFSAVPCITEDDSGELSAVGATLGTAHSPGYPIYCLATKLLVTSVRAGNRAYRVNLASSLAIAAAGAVLFLACLELSGSVIAAAALALAFSFSQVVWAMANVTEVYGLAALLTVLMLSVMLKVCADGNCRGTKYFYVAMFLFGLGLTAHYTIGLLLPGILWWAVSNRDRVLGGRWKGALFKGLLWSLAGFSVVLFLYLRARTNPVIGWEDPGTLGRFWQVIARLRYGTASLSQGGPPPLAPAMIAGKTAFFFSDMNANFTYLGSLLFLAGMYRFGRDKRLGWTLFILAAGSGPGFVLLANAGTDAVSRELMERFFFLPFIFIVLIMAGGLKTLPRYLRGVSVLLPVFLLWHNYPELNHRQEYMYYDYGRDILKTLPPGTLLFSDRADEMEFAVSYLHTAGGLRPDVKFIDCNAGATKSVYGDGYYRIWGKPRLRIRERVEGAMIDNFAGPVYYATFFPDMINIPRFREGLVFRTKPAGEDKRPFPYDEIYAFRVPPEPEYLNGRLTSLVLSYYQLLGEYSINQGDAEKGKNFSSGVSAFDESGRWTANLGFLFHQKNMTDAAVEFYLRALKKGAAASDIYTNLGVIYEQQGRLEEARKSYETAIGVSAGNFQAHYNLAVMYWKQGAWDGVIEEFTKALQIDPSNAGARRYLEAARAKKNQAKG